jgi:RNA polymerase sigma factor for flagellar operon FliA
MRNKLDSAPAIRERSVETMDERERTLLDGLAEVHYIAHSIHRRLPANVSLEDLAHSGVLGLIDAIEKFDSRKHVTFRKYSQFRIRGAILDSLRKLDWGPRSLRRQARRIEQARSVLASKLGRSPTDVEVATHLGLRLEELQSILKELHGLALSSWEALVEFSPWEEVTILRSKRAGEDPFETCVRAQRTRILAETMNTLDEQARRALVLYYFEERTMKEVGRFLNVKESRVSQIISKALDRLRTQLKERLTAGACERGQESEKQCDEVATILGVAP